MNPGVFSIKNDRVVFVAMAFALVGGAVAYRELGRLEDPEFTIKEAIIVTPYPGASAEEVALEVTNPIEAACQQLGQLDRVESESIRGRSVVKAVIMSRYDRHSMPQVWDELRRKINDVQPQLPPAVRGKSVVNDDFGDVYGIFLAITGEGFTYPELHRYTEFLRRELVLVDGVKKVELFGDPVVIRRDRFPTVTVRTDPRSGLPSQLCDRMRGKVEGIDLPPGYSLEWGGEYERSRDAQRALAKPLPYFAAAMIFIVVCLFNSIRATLLIWLVMPLELIGVTTGLLLTGKSFGFMALLGVLSLGGELIKNQIVVLSKVRTEIGKGKAHYQAILDGGTSKMRPVCLVVVTTALGMIPLLADAFFGAMAVCIMFALMFAAALSLIVTPVLYAIFFDVREGAAPPGARSIPRAAEGPETMPEKQEARAASGA